ncbi:MAG TPA: BON domain-containing protein [Candidatus Dormibacteraeota bacterium]|nr:BON domain-containing protein [Candidatus Dormibacteraeota bacterium]
MGRIRIAAIGFAAGAVAAALLDPERGRARRAELRDRAGGVMRRTVRQTQRGVRRAESELYGATQKLQHLQPEDEFPSDDRLLDRVQTELFRDPGVPKGQINISVEDGTVVLRGHVSDDSLRSMVERRAQGIAGVRQVDNRLNVTAG